MCYLNFNFFYSTILVGKKFKMHKRLNINCVKNEYFSKSLFVFAGVERRVYATKVNQKPALLATKKKNKNKNKNKSKASCPVGNENTWK